MHKVILFFLFTSLNTFAQDSLSVLFVGNSYTYVNDLPSKFNLLVQSKGDKLTVDSKTNGGYTFANHAADPLTYSKIHLKPWDYVVLQGQSQEPSFSTSQVNQQTLPSAVRLADSVYTSNFCSQVSYFMTWGRQNGDPQWDSINTFEKMNTRLRAAYLRFVDSTESSTVPVGGAWGYVREHYPSINLYSSDGSHPSVAGTYLTACSFYAGLFQKPSQGATYISGLDPLIAACLQRSADSVVLHPDSLLLWKLRPPHKVAIAQFSLLQNEETVVSLNSSWRAQDYIWDMGDGSILPQENIAHTYSSNGTFTVSLTAGNSCGSDTAAQEVHISTITAGLGEIEENGFKASWNDQGELILFAEEGVFCNVYSESGVFLYHKELLANEEHCPISDSAGVVIICWMKEGRASWMKLGRRVSR